MNSYKAVIFWQFTLIFTLLCPYHIRKTLLSLKIVCLESILSGDFVFSSGVLGSDLKTICRKWRKNLSGENNNLGFGHTPNGYGSRQRVERLRQTKCDWKVQDSIPVNANFFVGSIGRGQQTCFDIHVAASPGFDPRSLRHGSRWYLQVTSCITN